MTEGDVIFLSASVPYRQGWVANAKPAEIEEAIVSVARAVFSRKGRLLFGGHPSVSPLVAAVAGEYFAADPARHVRPVVTFQSRFYEGRLPDETTEMTRMGWSAIEWTATVPGTSADDPDPSLALMRDRMLLGSGEAFARHRLRPPIAMIGVGGMEGIRDEALVFLRKRRNWSIEPLPRVCLFKSGGGAAAYLLDPNLAPSRLWPRREPDLDAFEALRQAVRVGDIFDIEAVWWDTHRNTIPEDIPFQPYAAMAQSLLDTVGVAPGVR
jgi:hypothetical protein